MDTFESLSSPLFIDSLSSELVIYIYNTSSELELVKVKADHIEHLSVHILVLDLLSKDEDRYFEENWTHLARHVQDVTLTRWFVVDEPSPEFLFFLLRGSGGVVVSPTGVVTSITGILVWCLRPFARKVHQYSYGGLRSLLLLLLPLLHFLASLAQVPPAAAAD